MKTASAPATTILFVDDQPEILGLLADIAQSEGFFPICATSAAEALELVRQADPLAILSDLQMPGMDGFQFLEELRRGPWNGAFVFLSASGSPANQLRAQSLGALDFLPKPFNPFRIGEYLHGLVRTARALRRDG